MAQQRLYSACKSGDLKDIKQLHARGDVHPSFSSDIFLITWTFTRPDSDGRTPLFIACQEGHFEIVKWLHAHGAAMDVTRPNNKGSTPMSYACGNGHFEIVQWLHAHGAAMDVTRPLNDGATPMYIACQNGHFEIVQWLHAHGATMDVTRPRNDGVTPMLVACFKGHLEIVQWLLTHGADTNVIRRLYPRLSYSDKRQLHQAARENLFDCQSFLTLATIVRYINIEPYQVMNEETGRLVIPRSSILIFRHRNQHLLWSVARYICGGEETQFIWHLIRKYHKRRKKKKNK